MTLAQYRKKFPNLDFDRLTPAVEFALEPKDRVRLVRQIAAKVVRDYIRHTAAHVTPALARGAREALSIIAR